MTDPKLEQLIASYAGRNYAEPRKITVDTIDFEDHDDLDGLIAALTLFKEKNVGMTFSSRERESDYSSYVIGFDAERMETSQEVSVRVERYRLEVLDRKTKRRAEYERMKREFGDA